MFPLPVPSPFSPFPHVKSSSDRGCPQPQRPQLPTNANNKPAASLYSFGISHSSTLHHFNSLTVRFPQLDACTSREPFVNCGRLAKAKSNSVADVAELADALDSKSGSLWECGFDPLRRYHLNHGFSVL